MELNVGDKAPDFSLLNQKGKTVTLDSLKGKKVVLYFYPQDSTPTCTVEACNLRDNHKLLQKQGYTVLGISPDSVQRHVNFIAKQKLPFDLLADTETKMVQDYGVWAEKKMFGRTYMGVLRTTFLLDENGIITEIIRKVVSKDHAAQILGK
jgi:thioredoxin-dependent peroxiredoxin